MTSIFHPSTQEALDDQPSVEERRALIERVAASEHFSRSARLRDFLLYVGKQSLKNSRAEINEQEIGAQVFGRPANYDRSQDNIVRVNATELRKRIELYFATTGAQEPLLIEIPRGGYKPVFHRRVEEKILPTAASEAQTPSEARTDTVKAEAGRRSSRRIALLVLAAVCLLLAVGCALLYRQNRTMRKALNPWEGKPAVSAFWSEFLTSHQETDVVLPDTSVSLSVAISKNPIALNEYLNHSYKDRSENSTLSADRKSDLQEIFRHNLVTFGDVHAAQHILALDPASTSLHLTVARFFTADALKRDNVILIGGKEANPWVYLFDGQTNFSLAQDSDLHLYIANHHPLVGEEPNYAGTADQNLLLGYCVIAYLPNPSRTGNAIILAGTDSDATSAAAEFLASEDQMSKFRSTIHADKFPYFEVLLKTSRLSGTSFNAEVIAYRIHPEFR